MCDLIDLSPESDKLCKPTWNAITDVIIENNNNNIESLFPEFFEFDTEPKNNSKFEVLVSVPRPKENTTSNHSRKKSRFSVHVDLE